MIKIQRPLRKTISGKGTSNSALLLLIIFCFTFFLGWWGGGLKTTNTLNEQQIQFLFVIVPILATIVTALTQYVIREEVEKKADIKAKEKLEKVQETIQTHEKRIEDLQGINRNRVKLLLRVKQLTNEPLNSKDFIDARQKISAEIERLEAEENAANKIFDWLSKDENKIALMNYAFGQSLAVQRIDYDTYKMELSKFKEDIYRCIEWLQDSLMKGTPHYVRITQVANSIQVLPGKMKNHENALYAIKQHPKIAEMVGNSQNLRLFIDYLISDIRENFQEREILQRIDNLN